MLTLLRKPKPKWDDLKDKLRHRHGRHESDAAESRDSASEQQDGENGNDEHNGLKVCALPPGGDATVGSVKRMGLRRCLLRPNAYCCLQSCPKTHLWLLSF